MKIRLSKFVGRSQVPGDEVAFERVARAFAAAGKPKAAPSKSELSGHKVAPALAPRRKAA